MILFVGRIDYDMSGQVEGDTLKINIHSNKGDLVLEGKRV